MCSVLCTFLGRCRGLIPDGATFCAEDEATETAHIDDDDVIGKVVRKSVETDPDTGSPQTSPDQYGEVIVYVCALCNYVRNICEKLQLNDMNIHR